MNFRDRWETNENGEKFVFTVEMQRQLAYNDLPIEPAYLSQIAGKAPAARSERAPSPPPRQREERKREERPSKPKLDFSEPTSIQIDPQTGKYIGRMKWYNLQKGYGFIVRGGGEEMFFHKSNTAGDPAALAEGQWILYDVEETQKGPEATDIEAYDKG